MTAFPVRWCMGGIVGGDDNDDVATIHTLPAVQEGEVNLLARLQRGA